MTLNALSMHAAPGEIRKTLAFSSRRNHEDGERIWALGKLFKPRTVAVIGASANPLKPGSRICENLSSNPNIILYPVNPKYGSLAGHRCYARISDIPGKIDLAVISVPANLVQNAVEDCIKSGIKNLLIISSGFSEVGAAGLEMEKKLEEVVSKNGIRVLGPNTLGYVNTHEGIDVIFLSKTAFQRPLPGCVSMISQSGSLAVDFMEELAYHGTGLSYFIGLGNKIDITEVEALEYLRTDLHTRVVALYLENLSRGNEFFAACKNYPHPIVLLKGGRSSKGSRAAVLHTGRMGGNYKILKGVMEQLNLVLASDEVELLDYTRAFVCPYPPNGRRVVIITNGGGNGIIAADLIEERWNEMMEVVELPSSVKRKLGSKLPAYISPSNPVDLTSESTNEHYLSVIEMLAEERICDILLFGITPNEHLNANVVRGIAEVCKKYRIPAFGYVKCPSLQMGLIKKFASENIPVYPSVSRAVNATGTFAKWHFERCREHAGNRA
ncbi:MAG: CoA-binding protein [Thermoplasmata archaeon]|nr:CoA-binding protein [Thermoplasmata archaeon]